MESVINKIKNEKYNVYKPTGVEWLGEIPEHWELLKAKRFHKILKEPNSRKKCDNVLSLTLRGVVNNDPDSPEGLVPKDYSTYQIFEKDNLVFKLIDLENVRTSRVGILHEKGIMSSAYIRLIVGEDNFPRFTFYYYYSLYINEVYNNIGTGVRSTLGPNELLNLPFVKPSIEEQIQIAAYLDLKTKLIEKAIGIKEKLIELIKERRQILIHNAVIRGLNPNVKLKDSGVKWLEKIPEHWEVLYNRRLFREKSRKINNSKELALSLSQVDGVIPSEDMKERSLSPSHLDNFKLCLSGDLVVNRFKGHLGVFFESQYRGIITFHYGVFEPAERVNSKYFELLFHTFNYKTIYAGASNGMSIGLQNLSNQNFYDVRSIVPPINEQNKIVKYCQKIDIKIDTAIESKKKEIEKLKEYKSTLINSAVTGKIKVS
jgi:type I restriction enzyme S subunit